MEVFSTFNKTTASSTDLELLMEFCTGGPEWYGMTLFFRFFQFLRDFPVYFFWAAEWSKGKNRSISPRTRSALSSDALFLPLRNPSSKFSNHDRESSSNIYFLNQAWCNNKCKVASINVQRPLIYRLRARSSR